MAAFARGTKFADVRGGRRAAGKEEEVGNGGRREPDRREDVGAGWEE